MYRVIIPVTFSGILSFALLLLLHQSNAAVEIAQVKCVVFVNFSEPFHEAHRTCWEKMDKERKEGDEKEAKGKPYPINATVEEFEWDDKCMEHCIYQTAEMLGKDGALPDKKETETLFTKGKISQQRYESITSAWNDCLELSAKIGKEKGFDKCKIVTHHRHCISKKIVEAMSNSEVEC